jgi:hypothetical protein
MTDHLESRAMSDEWRVEVTLGDESGQVSMGEVLLASDLDNEAEEKLGGRVIVTHDGPHVFLYSRDEAGARAAEQVVRGLIAENGIDGSTLVTRWHPIEESWRDASEPLPETDEEREAEELRHEAAELNELAEQGTYDWEIRVELPGHRETAELADRLRAEGLAVTRRWRYLLVGALTEDDARALAARILEDAPEGARAELEPVFDRTVHPFFVWLEGRL